MKICDELKAAVLQAAVQGKLVPQNLSEGTGLDLYQQIRIKKNSLINEGEIKKEKPLSEISEDETLIEIPETWRWVRLLDLCSLISDGTHKTPTYVERGVPFLSVKDISQGIIDFSNTKFVAPEEHYQLTQRCKPEKDDVLICRIGTLGKALRVNTDVEFSIFVSLGLIKLIDSEIAEYIALVINSGYGFSWIQNVKVGGGTHTFKINLDDLRLMPIPLPPKNEQNRIVAKAKEIIAKIDELEKTENELESLKNTFPEDMKSALLQAAMQGKLTEQLPEDGTADGLLSRCKKTCAINEADVDFDIPGCWRWAALQDVVTMYTGNSISATEKAQKYTNLESGYDYIGTKDVGYNHIVQYDNGVRIPYDSTKFRHARPGAILLCIEGGSAGRKIAILDREVCFGNKLCTFHSTIVNEKYLYYYLQSPSFRAAFENNVTGIIGGVSINKLKKMLMPVPPLSEQQRIVERLDKLLPLCEDLTEEKLMEAV